MGAGLGLALSRRGHEITHLVRSDRPAPEGAGLSVGAPAWPGALAAASVVLIATPDSAIGPVAAALQELGAVRQSHTVLHLSGLHDRAALSALEASGAALGSLHPLQAVSDPSTAPARFEGAFAGVEGDERAMACAERLARAVGMTPVRLPAGTKASYHAAAAMTSNLTVALYALAMRIAERGGVPAESVGPMYFGLLRGTVENLEGRDPAAALTGAIRRGDAATVRAHLEALRGDEREVYRLLGREALGLAQRAGGLLPAALEEIRRLLGEAS